ncbi:MAG: hypothetical protein P4L10_04775 [Acidobacteriaceae bacterium]|nr:hypothetical protein [Acidobacteriaceae bacterium]
MTLPENSTDVKYSMNIKSMVFNEVDAKLFLIRDSTDAEKLHQTLVEQKYRGALLSTVTHEFKTPLMIIRGNLESWISDNAEGKNVIQVGRTTPPQIQAALLATRTLKYFLRDISVLCTLDNCENRT